MSGSTSLNNPYAPAYAIRPRLRVMSNGVELPQSLAAQISSSNHFQADRFNLSFVPTLSGIGSPQWWSQQTFIPVDIQLGLLPLGAPPTAIPSWTSILTGEVDKMSFEPPRNLITLEGRDLTAHFIDNKTTGSYVNQSSSDIVTTLAASRGLTAKVTETDGTTGRFWSADRETSTFNQSSKNTTEWDLIVSLAKKEGYDAFVQGTTLYFQPETDPTSTPYVWFNKIDAQGRQTGNVRELKMDRVLTVAKGLNVTVNSWHSKQNRAFSRTSSTQASIGPDGKMLAQNYVLQRPNMTEDEAQAYADKTAQEFASHELLIEAEMPGDLLLTPRVMVSLQGTGTIFDQAYYAVSVTKVISVSAGFTMHASCKNKASEDQ